MSSLFVVVFKKYKKHKNIKRPYINMDFVATNSIGLFFGIGSVVLGQIAVLSYIWSSNAESRKYNFETAVMSHFTQIEGILLLGIYLSVSWYGKWLPPAYYIRE